MGALTPTELLRGWEQGTVPPEMAIGHLVQNLVKLQTSLELHMHALAQLRAACANQPSPTGTRAAPADRAQSAPKRRKAK